MGLLGARFEVGGGRGEITSPPLWQFPFIRDWPEIWKSEIPPSEFCPTSGDWGELGIPNLAQTSQTKCYWMLQNARVTALVS